MPDRRETPPADAHGPVFEDGEASGNDLSAAIARLDHATRSFGERIDSLRRRSAYGAPKPTRGAAPAGEGGSSVGAGAHEADDLEDAWERRMREAEREAAQYLERAKSRADSIVNTMVGALEHEAAEIRREAEEGIRERWQAVEAEAGRYLEDAKRVADGMVAERQQRIGGLSDRICERADSLASGMEDAERIRRQFDSFVRALSRTAHEIAEQPSDRSPAEITRLGEVRGGDARSTIAA